MCDRKNDRVFVPLISTRSGTNELRRKQQAPGGRPVGKAYQKMASKVAKGSKRADTLAPPNKPAPRDRTLHFRVPAAVANRLEDAAAEDRRSVSAWVALCVEEKLRDRDND